MPEHDKLSAGAGGVEGGAGPASPPRASVGVNRHSSAGRRSAVRASIDKASMAHNSSGGRNSMRGPSTTSLGRTSIYQRVQASGKNLVDLGKLQVSPGQPSTWGQSHCVGRWRAPDGTIVLLVIDDDYYTAAAAP